MRRPCASASWPAWSSSASRASDQDVTVTIVGGGATGVELAGTLAELRNIGLPSSYPDIDPQCVHIRLVEQAPVLLTPYVPPLQEYARSSWSSAAWTCT